nr:hypothetical protein CFP56_71105 [Quercus suber]
MADDTRQSVEHPSTPPDLSKESLNVHPEHKPFSGSQWKSAEAAPYKPPENANMLAGGTQHTAGGQMPEVSITNAFDGGLKWSDFTNLPKKPCVRDSLLLGIGAGFATLNSRSSDRKRIKLGRRHLLRVLCRHVPILSFQTFGRKGGNDARCRDPEPERTREKSERGKEGEDSRGTKGAEGQGAGCAVCSLERESRRKWSGNQRRYRGQKLVEDVVGVEIKDTGRNVMSNDWYLGSMLRKQYSSFSQPAFDG